MTRESASEEACVRASASREGVTRAAYSEEVKYDPRCESEEVCSRGGMTRGVRPEEGVRD